MRLAQQPPHVSPRREALQPQTPEMLRQWSVQGGQAPQDPEPKPAGEDLWEQEMERLCSSQEPLRMLPYAMVDKRLIR